MGTHHGETLSVYSVYATMVKYPLSQRLTPLGGGRRVISSQNIPSKQVCSCIVVERLIDETESLRFSSMVVQIGNCFHCVECKEFISISTKAI